MEKEGKNANDLASGDIISAGVNEKDELCLKVVKKFAQILAVEVGNMALKTLPFGGIFLVGGVTYGIQHYIETDKDWVNTMYNKGRLSAVMRRVPVYIVKSEVELGILGAEECAFRNLGSYCV